LEYKIKRSLKQFFRSALEWLARDTIIRRKIYSRRGNMRIYITPDSQLKYLLPNVDSQLERVIQTVSLEAARVVDVGANCGTFGFYAILNGARQVTFIEPDVFCCGIIEKSIQSNNLWDKCSVIPCAVGSSQAVASFDVSNRGRASSALSDFGRSQTGGVRYSKEVVVTTLDFVLAPYRGEKWFLKIDVEGAEFKVVSGAKNFIALKKPLMLIEVNAQTRREIDQMLSSLGYVGEEVFENNILYTVSGS